MKLNKYMALAGIVATVIPGQALVVENVRTATDNRPVAKVERGVVKLSLKSPDGRQEATFFAFPCWSEYRQPYVGDGHREA